MSKETSARIKYADIIDLPHHVSTRHAAMPMADRAAQFSPFAALTGYDDAVKETGRLTDERPELSEHDRSLLDAKLLLLESLLAKWGGIGAEKNPDGSCGSEAPVVCVTFFVADRVKSGGHSESLTGRLIKIDKYKRQLTVEGQAAIRIDDIISLECDDFKALE